jgi:streptogramin lyase
VIAAAVAGLAAAGAAAVLLGTGGGKHLPPPPAPPPAVAETLKVGGRPNGVAVGKGLVFVTDYGKRRLRLIDERTARPRPSAPRVGVGAVDVVAGLGAAWVAGFRQRALYKFDLRTGRQLARFPLPRAPKSVGVGPKGVWVGMLTEVPGTPDTLARIDPRTGKVLGTYPVPEGAGPLVVTPTAVWVVHRLSAAVSRFNPATGRFDKHVRFGDNRLGKAAFGAGSVWVTSPLEDTVVRIDAKTGAKVSSGVGRRPTGIVAQGHAVWVTSYIDHTLTRIDARTSRPAGKPVPAPLNPYSLAMSGDSLWVTAVGHGEVARVDHAAAR